jgi:hypothetical protein
MILSRIDHDDFVNKFAVQDARDLLNKRDFQVILCGYDKGYKYLSGSNKIAFHEVHHKDGHMSAFQSIVCKTFQVPYARPLNPFNNNHTKTRLGI